jgi:hypothetical protein
MQSSAAADKPGPVVTLLRDIVGFSPAFYSKSPHRLQGEKHCCNLYWDTGHSGEYENRSSNGQEET